MNKLKIFLFPFCILLYFPMIALFGVKKISNFIDWVTEDL